MPANTIDTRFLPLAPLILLLDIYSFSEKENSELGNIALSQIENGKKLFMQLILLISRI